jgi:2-aminoadipate transaminase
VAEVAALYRGRRDAMAATLPSILPEGATLTSMTSGGFVT